MTEVCFGPSVTVRVDEHNVCGYVNGKLRSPSGVDYYYSDRGYGCKDEYEVAQQYYCNFLCAKSKHPLRGTDALCGTCPNAFCSVR